jgi:hypothetical protein
MGSPSVLKPCVVGALSAVALLLAAQPNIGEKAWADHLMLYGTKGQALALTALGYRLVRRRPPSLAGATGLLIRHAVTSVCTG